MFFKVSNTRLVFSSIYEIWIKILFHLELFGNFTIVELENSEVDLLISEKLEVQLFWDLFLM